MPKVFATKGTPITSDDVTSAVEALGGDEASLWALVAVETKGFGYFDDRRPQILFERHIFHKRTGGKFSAFHPDISNPEPRGYIGGPAEYGRLAKAMQLDETAALESASWGLGQVMGFNAKTVGFDDVRSMVAAMVGSEGAQLRASVNFISANTALLTAFKEQDWRTVALHYNGESFAENHYDEHLAQHHEVYSDPAHLPDIGLRTAQTCLTYLGFRPNGVDGVLGAGSRAALLAYRKIRGLPPGALDDDVLKRLIDEAGI